VKKTLNSVFSLQSFVPRGGPNLRLFLHRFRLCENASGCRSGERHAAERVKKTLNSVFFTPELCAAGRPKAPLIESEKPVPGFLLALPL